MRWLPCVHPHRSHFYSSIVDIQQSSSSITSSQPPPPPPISLQSRSAGAAAPPSHDGPPITAHFNATASMDSSIPTATATRLSAIAPPPPPPLINRRGLPPEPTRSAPPPPSPAAAEMHEYAIPYTDLPSTPESLYNYPPPFVSSSLTTTLYAVSIAPPPPHPPPPPQPSPRLPMLSSASSLSESSAGQAPSYQSPKRPHALVSSSDSSIYGEILDDINHGYAVPSSQRHTAETAPPPPPPPPPSRQAHRHISEESDGYDVVEIYASTSNGAVARPPGRVPPRPPT